MYLKKTSSTTIVILVFITITIIFSACKNDRKVIQKEIKKEVKSTPLDHKTEQQQYPIVNIKPNQLIKSPFKVTVNSNGVWHAFEGELGFIKVYNEAGKEIGNVGILHTDSTKEIDWMADGPIPFETILTFDPKGSKKGKIVIEKNAGRARDADSFEIPVRF